MSLNIGQSLQEGLARTIASNGLVLTAVMAALTAVTMTFYNTAFLALFPAGTVPPSAMFGPTLPISPVMAAVITALLYLVTIVVVAAALRTFVSEDTRSLPAGRFTRNLPLLLANLVIGYILFFLALWIGFLLLILPGVWALVNLYFWFVIVTVEDEPFWTAFQRSYEIAKGNRWSLLGLGLIVMAVGAVIYGVLFAVTWAGSPWLTLVVYGVLGAVYSIFSLATTARAYVQISDEAPVA
mgnify:CR=1 FL=1